jgi:hypothetical protein
MGVGRVKKKPPCGRPRAIFDKKYFLTPHIALLPHTAIRGHDKCMSAAMLKSKKIIALKQHISYLCKHETTNRTTKAVVQRD